MPCFWCVSMGGRVGSVGGHAPPCPLRSCVVASPRSRVSLLALFVFVLPLRPPVAPVVAFLPCCCVLLPPVLSCVAVVVEEVVRPFRFFVSRVCARSFLLLRLARCLLRIRIGTLFALRFPVFALALSLPPAKRVPNAMGPPGIGAAGFSLTFRGSANTNIYTPLPSGTPHLTRKNISVAPMELTS